MRSVRLISSALYPLVVTFLGLAAAGVATQVHSSTHGEPTQVLNVSSKSEREFQVYTKRTPNCSESDWSMGAGLLQDDLRSRESIIKVQ